MLRVGSRRSMLLAGSNGNVGVLAGSRRRSRMLLLVFTWPGDRLDLALPLRLEHRQAHAHHEVRRGNRKATNDRIEHQLPKLLRGALADGLGNILRTWLEAAKFVIQGLLHRASSIRGPFQELPNQSDAIVVLWFGVLHVRLTGEKACDVRASALCRQLGNLVLCVTWKCSTAHPLCISQWS